MVGRVIGGTLAGAALGAGALVLGFKGYQAYLRWLVAGSTQPPPAPTRPDAGQDASPGPASA